MVSHLVLMKPRGNLSPVERDRLVTAFERAIGEIPTVRNVRVGRRVVYGAGYEERMPETADYFVMIEFDDLQGLTSYLRHPAHEELGVHFRQSLLAGLIYDFEDVRLGSLRGLA